MRQLVLVAGLLVCLSGCVTEPGYTRQQLAPAFYANPTFLSTANYECLWENVVDIVGDYFSIEREEPVRLVGNIVTEGRLDTFPAVGSTLFEPWRGDSAGPYEKLESTLQSIRRRAVVRVIPGERGFWIDVAVFKELEDVLGPGAASPGSATFPHNVTLTRVVNPVDEQDINDGWIPLGRDPALEQRILEQLLARMGTVAMR